MSLTRAIAVAEALLEHDADVHVVDLTTADVPDIERAINTAFGHYGDWVYPYTEKSSDWTLSKKAVYNGKFAGCYMLAWRSILDEIQAEKMESLEDLSQYADKKGLEGIALVVLPEFRNLGIGRALKDATRLLGADYMWGAQLKTLGNLEQWLHRRRLVAHNEDMYLTLEDL